MRMYDIIEKKRDGHALTKEEITFFIDAYTKGKIADYQASALLMAIYIQGMTMEESAHLTKAMVHSGEIIDLSAINGIKVDKHSTGGVGDTTTLILAPLVASVGVKVAKMSGRGLGHTGGTLDKLEAIDGFTIEISNKRFIDLVNKNNVAVIGQSNDLAPADKLLYQLRDVTATVSSIPLIASSIMSKKIASGADAIVLDVKTGSGAFMKSFDHAKKLAETMVRIGQLNDVKTSALITNMDQPLGNYIGNALEVYEAILTLKGEGPKDLTELTIQLGAHMVVQAKKASSISEAKQMLKENIKNGKAIEYLKTFIKAQGGNEHIVDEPKQLINATYTYTIKAKETGYISNLHAEEIGKCAMMLGAGRETLDSIIDLAVGIVVHKKIGQHVREGDVLFTIHTNSEPKEDVVTLLKQSYELSETKTNEKLILHVID